MAWIKQRPVTESGSAIAPTEEAPRAAAPARERSMESIVNIGQSVEIKGTLTGNEDLTIEGMVDGKILVKDHSLTIGANGRITAEVHAKTVVVVGQVVGNITADDKVEIAPSGSVEGDIRAPRVAIADGAKFKGSIDMDRKGSVATKGTGTSASATPGCEHARRQHLDAVAVDSTERERSQGLIRETTLEPHGRFDGAVRRARSGSDRRRRTEVPRSGQDPGEDPSRGQARDSRSRASLWGDRGLPRRPWRTRQRRGTRDPGAATQATVQAGDRDRACGPRSLPSPRHRSVSISLTGSSTWS